MTDLSQYEGKVKFLGTGTSQGVPVIGCNCKVCRSNDPKDYRLRSSLLVSINGINLLIDAGTDFRQQMLKYQINSLRAIILTHEHADHILGLDDIRSYNWMQKKPMDIYAEERVEKAVKRVYNYVFEEHKYPGIPRMTIHRIDENSFYIDGILVIPIRAFHHKLPVLGFRFGNLAYLTDANYIPEEEKAKLSGVKILIVNALHKQKHISHFNLDEAIYFSKEINPEITYLTHISHIMGNYKKIQKELPEKVFFAYDGLELIF